MNTIIWHYVSRTGTVAFSLCMCGCGTGPAPCRLDSIVCRISPSRFLAECRKRRLNNRTRVVLFCCILCCLLFSRPYWRSCLCYSVASVCRLSVMLCIVAKRCVLEQYMVNGSRYYRALESVSRASALSSALAIYPCQIRVHQRWQSKLQLPTARKKEQKLLLTGSRIWRIDWYQNEWPWPLFRGRLGSRQHLRHILHWISQKPLEI